VTSRVKNATKINTAATDNANNAKYQELLNSAPGLNIRISDNQRNDLGGIPATGTIGNINGRLVMVINQGRDKEGRDADFVEIMDVATGTKKTFTGKRNDDNAVTAIGGWVDGIAAL